MKWWKVGAVVGAFALIIIAATLIYYGGGEENDHEIVGYVSGVVTDINTDAWSFKVGEQTIYVRGRYNCGGTIFYAEDILTKITGEDVRIGYSEDLGYQVAEKIEINGTTCTRIPGRGRH